MFGNTLYSFSLHAAPFGIEESEVWFTDRLILQHAHQVAEAHMHLNLNVKENRPGPVYPYPAPPALTSHRWS